MMRRIALAAMLAPLVAACVSVPATHSPSQLAAMQANYERALMDLRSPANEDERTTICRQFRVERARMEGASTRAYATLSPATAADIDARTRRNIALIESRMAEFRCP